MPRGNIMGPRGFGPMTGRGMGWCTGYAATDPVFGYGRGRGFFRPIFGRRLPMRRLRLFRRARMRW